MNSEYFFFLNFQKVNITTTICGTKKIFFGKKLFGFIHFSNGAYVQEREFKIENNLELHFFLK